MRHDNKVTKYNTHTDGMGATDHPNEAAVLRFIKANTTIPVSQVFSSDWDRITTMQYIEGQTLRQAWPVLTTDQRSDILDQLQLLGRLGDHSSKHRNAPGGSFCHHRGVP